GRNDDREPARAAVAGADRRARARARCDPRRGLRRARRPRPPLHHEHDRDAPPPARDGPRAALRLALQAVLDRRHHAALAGEDPREHGDRPQRDARPVGLDERPPDPLLALGLGLRLHQGGLEALPQLRPPHVHEHPRQGSRPRLRDHAGRPAPALAPGLPGPADLQPDPRRPVRVGRRPPRPRLRRDPRGREAQGADRRGGQGDDRQGAPADRQGLRRVPPAQRAARPPRVPGRLPVDAEGRRDGQRGAQRLGLRDHLLRPLPRPDLHVQPGGGRGREPRRLLRPSAPRRGEHRGLADVPRHQREPRLPGRAPPLPRHAEHAVRGDRAAGQGAVRALRAPVQLGPVPLTARRGAAHDPPPRLPGRQAPAQAGPLPRRRGDRRGPRERQRQRAPPRPRQRRLGHLRARAEERRRAGRHALAGL
ncbi:MAG: Linoleoyl-CoA desaturase, partial [uncultured Solirubrobacteraceae bacterium]